VIAEQAFHIHESVLGGLLSAIHPSAGPLQKPSTESFRQHIALLLQQGENLLLDQLAHGFTAQVIVGCFVKGSLNEFLDEQPMHFTAAQEAFRGIDDAVHQRSIRFGIQLLKLEFPVQMTALPARRMQARHHRL